MTSRLGRLWQSLLTAGVGPTAGLIKKNLLRDSRTERTLSENSRPTTQPCSSITFHAAFLRKICPRPIVPSSQTKLP